MYSTELKQEKTTFWVVQILDYCHQEVRMSTTVIEMESDSSWLQSSAIQQKYDVILKCEPHMYFSNFQQTHFFKRKETGENNFNNIFYLTQ